MEPTQRAELCMKLRVCHLVVGIYYCILNDSKWRPSICRVCPSAARWTQTCWRNTVHSGRAVLSLSLSLSWATCPAPPAALGKHVNSVQYWRTAVVMWSPDRLRALSSVQPEFTWSQWSEHTHLSPPGSLAHLTLPSLQSQLCCERFWWRLNRNKTRDTRFKTVNHFNLVLSSAGEFILNMMTNEVHR